MNIILKRIKVKVILTLIPILLLFIIASVSVTTSIIFSSNDESSSSVVLNVSQSVLAWKPVVEKYAEMYGMKEYVNLILAVMQQESGGTVPDVMQSSEGAFNKNYPHVPNGITDPEYSISCGIQELKEDFQEAGVKDPSDLIDIKLALQGYNFGTGYIIYAKGHGGYSKETVQVFENMEGGKYGDVDYVDHVLRYYIVSSSTQGNNSIISAAQQQLGKPYVWGASGPDSFDCSGLVYYVYNASGKKINRLDAQSYYNMCTKTISPSPGDLVFFGTSTQSVEHVGIYIGNDKMIDAPHTGDVVKVEDIWNIDFIGYGHIN